MKRFRAKFRLLHCQKIQPSVIQFKGLRKMPARFRYTLPFRTGVGGLYSLWSSCSWLQSLSPKI